MFVDPVLSHAWQITGDVDDRATTDEEDGHVATGDVGMASHRKEEKSTHGCRLDGRPRDHQRGGWVRSHRGRMHDSSSEGGEEHTQLLPAGRTTARPPTRRTGAQPPGTMRLERRRLGGPHGAWRRWQVRLGCLARRAPSHPRIPRHGARPSTGARQGRQMLLEETYTQEHHPHLVHITSLT